MQILQKWAFPGMNFYAYPINLKQKTADNYNKLL